LEGDTQVATQEELESDESIEDIPMDSMEETTNVPVMDSQEETRIEDLQNDIAEVSANISDIDL